MHRWSIGHKKKFQDVRRTEQEQWLKVQTAVRQQPVRPGEGFIPETGSKALSEERTAKGCAEIWRYHRSPTRLSGPSPYITFDQLFDLTMLEIPMRSGTI